MSDLTRWILTDEVDPDDCNHKVIKRDDSLQAIADAPRCQHGMIDDHQYEKYGTYWGRQETFVRDCDGAEELRALLDALVEGTDDDS